MNRQELIGAIHKKRSFLCVGLDPDMDRIPKQIRQDFANPLFAFNRMIIDATIDFAVAYKPNIAFYECHGSRGWESLEKTAEYLASHPKGPVFTIADAKRGDIGNSSVRYATTFLRNMPFDAVTVNPYMGSDSVQPFLEISGKWTILLALTSNPGASDFQMLHAREQAMESPVTQTIEEPFLYEKIIEKCLTLGNPANMMFVVGATRTDRLRQIRQLAPDHFFLLPGVGAQGASLEDVAATAMNSEVGMLVNSSRGIIHASEGDDFTLKAREAAAALQKKMEAVLAKVT